MPTATATKTAVMTARMSSMRSVWPMSAHTRGRVRCHTSPRDALRPRMVRETVTMSRPMMIEVAIMLSTLVTPSWTSRPTNDDPMLSRSASESLASPDVRFGRPSRDRNRAKLPADKSPTMPITTSEGTNMALGLARRDSKAPPRISPMDSGRSGMIEGLGASADV